MRSFLIEDEGYAFEFHLIDDEQQVGGGVIEIEPLGVDAAYQLAVSVCQTFMLAGGVWGGARPI